MIENFFYNLWQVFLDLSPSLLLGLLVAGLLHAYLPKGLIHRGISQPTLRSAWRASLIGVPMPLCSCGVVPTALALRNEGASKGATISFLISTPQTGVDSVFVSASLLGLPFALFKLVAAFVSGLLGGVLVNRFTTHDTQLPLAAASGSESDSNLNRPLQALRYAVFDLLGAIDLWILGGVVVAALITTLVPENYFADQAWSQGLVGMLVVLALSVPLYVCTTGSVPIAASLIAAGMPLGSALVFLMAGPATNLATIGALYRVLGGRVLTIYLGTVVAMSVLLGLCFDFVLAGAPPLHGGHLHGPTLLSLIAALLVIGLLLFLSLRRVQRRVQERVMLPQRDQLLLKVEGMTCSHCVARVKGTLEGCAAVQEALPSLTTGLVRVRGEHLDATALIQAIERAGYKVVE